MTDFYREIVFGDYTPDTPGWASHWDRLRKNRVDLYT